MPSRASRKRDFRWLVYLPRALNLRTVLGFLLIQDGLLAEIDEQLPFSGHVAGTVQQIHFVQRFFTAGYFVGTQEVVVSYPKRDTVYGAIVCSVTAESAIGFFEGTVQSFDDLFEGSVFLGDSIVIGQTDDLGYEDIPFLLEFKLLSSKGIGTVPVSNEFQCFAGEFLKLVTSHTHGKDTRTYIS